MGSSTTGSAHIIYFLWVDVLCSQDLCLGCGGAERANKTRLLKKKNKKSVSGGRCQLCMEIVVFGLNPGIRCSREESFLGPRQSTIVAWELCVHAWVCMCICACACMHVYMHARMHACTHALLIASCLPCLFTSSFRIYVLGRPPPFF